MITVTIRNDGLKKTEQVCSESRVVKKSLHFLDYRNASIDSVRNMIWFENWSQTGKIEEREGQAVKICAPTTEYVNEIDIAGMGDIVSLMKRYGSVRVCRSRYDEYEYDLELF